MATVSENGAEKFKNDFQAALNEAKTAIKLANQRNENAASFDALDMSRISSSKLSENDYSGKLTYALAALSLVLMAGYKFMKRSSEKASIERE